MRDSADSDAGPGRDDAARPTHAPRPPATDPDPGPPGLGGDDVGDARLVERVRDGDDAAFATLVVRYEPKLGRVRARMVHDEERARALAQEAFWKVYPRLDRFDPARRFGPWLFRVGVNLGLDLLRRREGPPASS